MIFNIWLARWGMKKWVIFLQTKYSNSFLDKNILIDWICSEGFIYQYVSIGLVLVSRRSGARPTNDISIEFEIRPKLAVFCFKIYSTDHNEILYTSRQYDCRDVCKTSL